MAAGGGGRTRAAAANMILSGPEIRRMQPLLGYRGRYGDTYYLRA
jgi:hypothetical protein